MMITPRRAAREIPDTSAIGAARISGHGVATARTARPELISGQHPRATGHDESHRTKIRAYRSAMRTNGAFCSCAWATSRINSGVRTLQRSLSPEGRTLCPHWPHRC